MSEEENNKKKFINQANQKKKFAFLYKTYWDVAQEKKYNIKKKLVFSYMRNNTQFTDEHGVVLKRSYNEEGYDIKECLGFQEPIREINYITPLEVTREAKRKKVNPLGACDFETVTIPARDIPATGNRLLKNYELETLKQEIYEDKLKKEKVVMLEHDFTEFSPAYINLYKEMLKKEEIKMEQDKAKESKPEDEDISESGKALAEAFKSSKYNKQMPVRKVPKPPKPQVENITNLLEKNTLKQVSKENAEDILAESEKDIFRNISFVKTEDQYEDINVISRIISSEDENLSPDQVKNKRFNEKKKVNEGKDFTHGEGQLVIAASFVFDNKKYSFLINKKIFETPKRDPALIIAASDELMYTFWETLINVSRDYMTKNRTTEKIVFYFHNLGLFDGYFLSKFLLNNVKCQDDFHTKEKLEQFNLDGKIIKMKYENIVFLDSLLMTNLSLKDLAREVLNEKKGEFNVKENDYNTMKKVFNNTDLLKEFKDYNLKDSILLYKIMINIQQQLYLALRIDVSEAPTCPGLAISYFRKYNYYFPPIIYPKISYTQNDTDFTNKKVKRFSFCKTRKFVNLKTQKFAIFVTKPFYEQALRNAFYGGRTELFKPFGQHAIILDVNSQYPFAACAPLPFGSPVRVDVSKWNINDLRRFYGFIRIRFVSPPNEKLLPVLPRKHPDYRNVYSLGAGNGWYFCKEVQLAYNMGYKIEVLEAISFKPHIGFRKMIRRLYELRKKAKEENNLCLYIMYKNIMNTGSYGRFALDFTKPIITMKNLDKKTENLNKFLSGHDINSINITKNNVALISHTEKPKISLKHRLSQKRRSYLAKPASNISLDSIHDTYTSGRYSLTSYKRNSQAIHLSAAITSTARVNLYPFLNKLYGLDLLLYTDTDSLHCLLNVKTLKIVEKILDINFSFDFNEFTFKELKDLLLILNKIKSNSLNLLGKLKLEDYCLSITYAMQKLYAKEGSQKSMVKAKGIDKTLLTDPEEIEVLIEAIKEGSTSGELKYTTQPVSRISRNKKTFEVTTKQSNAALITNQSFSKFRTQVFNEKNEWVDTKSLILDDNFNSISIEELTIIYNKFVTPFPVVIKTY